MPKSAGMDRSVFSGTWCIMEISKLLNFAPRSYFPDRYMHFCRGRASCYWVMEWAKYLQTVFLRREEGKFCLLPGLSFFLVFFILRSYNHYGDPVHWDMQRTQLFSWLSFINLSKYPPSLDYICSNNRRGNDHTWIT